jgi:hypothetical protein
MIINNKAVMLLTGNSSSSSGRKSYDEIKINMMETEEAYQEESSSIIQD